MDQEPIIHALQQDFATEKRLLAKNRWSNADRIKRMRENICLLRSQGWTMGQIDRKFSVTGDIRRRVIRERETFHAFGGRKYDMRKIFRMHQEGMSRHEICKITGIDSSDLTKRFKRAGIPTVIKRSEYSLEEKQMTLDLYHQGLGARCISEQMKKKVGSVRNLLLAAKVGRAVVKQSPKPFSSAEAIKLWKGGYSMPMIATIFDIKPTAIRYQWRKEGILYGSIRPQHMSKNDKIAVRLEFTSIYGQIDPRYIESQEATVHSERGYVRRYITRNGKRYLFAKFQDTEKLFILSNYLTYSYHGSILPASVHQQFIHRFYDCEATDLIFRAWRDHDRNKWWRPSMDHKVPSSQGGEHEIENIRFVTRFENLVKSNRTVEEWHAFRRDTGTESALFLENIVLHYRVPTKRAHG